MRFEKWHALGNAYLLVERPDSGDLGPERVRRLCDVRLGIGADGVLEITARNDARATVRIWNPDGSTAELSGNGTRIAAAWLLRETGSADVEIDTGSRIVPVNVGNPHAVVLRSELSRDDLLRLGPAIESHPRFPQRTNVQLARPEPRDLVQVLVWERGAGETSASGSSAAAVAAAAVARGWSDSPVRVSMPGGTLVVGVERGAVSLEGPAEQVCEGTTPL